MANPFDIYGEVEARKPVSIDGHTLSIADIISVARHGVDVSLSKASAVHKRIDDSVAFLESKKHLSIYGVSTGFGGSADTRTGDLSALQVSLLEHQLCGYLPLDASYEFLSNNHSMPIPIVRGAIAIRVNSLARGHSGVRKVVLQALLDLLNNGLVPCVPLRGSISASGDLSPLSYVAGAICGHPDVRVFDTKNKEVLYATEAIEKYKLNKITLAAKEGLGLVNGTAFSASAGCLAFYDALNLASTSLAATAMTVEAMVGQVGSFDQFIHDVTRPHAGQIAAAAFVRSLLAGSKLAVSEEGEVAIQDDVGILRQDRYALRTSAQWIGPQLESLALARSQIEAELNSTTDNPLLDVEGDKIHHGGNFQAMAITQAMESTRLVLEHLGKLSFSQVTELINCSMNRGLPSCLAGDEPSTNYHTKGLDIHSAAYCSELGYLANPVSTHVQSTEMHNQSVNSLALISARKTIESNDVLSLLLGTHLYCAAQAIDLRIADVKFQAQVRQLLNEQIKKHFGSALQGKDLEKLQHKVFVALLKRLEETASSDSGPRFEDASRHIMGHLMETVVPLIAINPGVAASLGSFQKEFLEGSLSLYRSIRKATTTGNDNLADAKENMGSTIVIYQCIRGELGVSVRRGDVAEGKHGRSVGGNVSRIVTALRDGRLVKAVGEAAGYVKIGEQNGAARGGISDPRSMHGHGGSFY